MTLEQINAEMAQQKKHVAELARELGVNVNALRQILAGQRSLTKQLEKHIQLALGLRKDTLVMFKVEFPDEEVSSWLPGWDKLSEEERRATVSAIVREVAMLGTKRGWEELSEPEREKLRALGREVAYWSNQTGVPVYRVPESMKPFA